MRSSRSRRHLALLVAGLTAFTVAMGGTGAQARPDPVAPNVGDRLPAATASTQEITLITGDVVRISTPPDGKASYDVTAAAWPQRRVSFTVRSEANHVYVVPSDVEQHLRAGSIDPALFDVTALRKEQSSGAARTTLPIIVSRNPAMAARTAEQALPAAKATRQLGSIKATALTVDLGHTVDFWRAIDQQLPPVAEPARPTGQARLSVPAARTGAVEKIWLDRTVRADLAESVPQIGAPALWNAGFDGAGVTVAVLDTGIDPNHPDVASRVVGSANFTTDLSIVDGHGHGTHVASTVAGSGAASQGRYRGVAPGASLLIGKVIGDSGSGSTSGVIAGMEWAAAHGARVVSMSLGTDTASDGTDVASQAVDLLTAQYGTLFVIAAGNRGPGAPTIGSPGAAEAALTVGAVDKQDTLAAFSSRGPRIGDGGVKPNITGPGVDIIAARAAGTGLGTPVDDQYTRLTGTSMATPHVAGAAALLAQAHPDWTGERIREALVGAAHPGDATVYQQGSGRVDVKRAYEQPVTASPATVGLGSFTPGQSTGPVTRTVHYTNDDGAPVTLDLSLDIRDTANRPVPSSGLRLGGNQLTVPAHGGADLAVTLDPSTAARGPVGGILTAASNDGRVAVRTALGYYQGPPTRAVTVRALDSTGAKAAGVLVEAVRVDDQALGTDPLVLPHYQAETDETGEATLRVPDGVYDLLTTINEGLTFTTPERSTYVDVIELDVTGRDRTVVLDARTGVALRPATPLPTDQRSFVMSRSRVTAAGAVWQWLDTRQDHALSQSTAFYATPTTKARIGRVDFSQHWSLYQSSVELTLLRRGPDVPLHPTYSAFPYNTASRVDGVHEHDVVFVGHGTGKELAGVDVRGKVALVRIDPLNPPAEVCAPVDPPICLPVQAPLDAPTAQLLAFVAAMNLEQAGALAAVFYANLPGSAAVLGEDGATLTHFGLSYAEGEQLRRELAIDRRTQLKILGRWTSPVVYQLHLRQDALPSRTPNVDQNALVRIDATYRYDTPGAKQLNSSLEFTHSWGPIDLVSVVTGVTNLVPLQRIEYVGPADADVLWLRASCQYPPYCLQSYDAFPRPERTEEDWFSSPMYFGVPRLERSELMDDRLGLFCVYCRDGDYLWSGARTLLDGASRHYADRGDVELWEPATTIRLFRDGIEVPPTTVPWRGPGVIAVFQLAPTPGRYTLEQVDTVTPSEPLKIMARKVTTTWTFRSERPRPGQELKPRVYACPISVQDQCAFQPVMMIEYDLGLDIHNRAPAARHRGSRPWTFTIQPYHTDPAAPRITDATVWSSTDGGASWQPAHVTRGPHDQFQVTVRHPALDQTDGYVWLKVRAVDAAGNSITQVTERAYGLIEQAPTNPHVKLVQPRVNPPGVKWL